MSLLLTGSTGYIGSEILSQALSNPLIASLVLLTRRPIPDLNLEENPKVRVVVMSDFGVYDEALVREIEGAEGVLWAMGTYDGNPVVEIQYPTAFAHAFLKGKREKNGKKFHFVFLRGAYTVEDQERSLWFMSTARKGNGLGELTMRTFAEKNGCEESWETYIVKPGGILRKDALTSLNVVLRPVMDCVGAIRSDEVAACMIDIALNGSEKKVWQNNDMVAKGRAILGR